MNSNIQTTLFTEQEAPPIGNVLLADSASYQIIQVALELAFEAGKWAGQVELEEHYDRSQFAEAFLEAAYARKNSMPMKEASTGRTVTVNLRSDKWREGVRKSSREYLDKAMAFVFQHFR
jgi:hypothetical protein